MENRAKRGAGKRRWSGWFRSDNVQANGVSGANTLEMGRALQIAGIGFLLICAVTYLLMPGFSSSASNLRVGNIAPEDIKSPFTMEVVDRPTTERLRALAADGIPPVFDFDTKVVRTLQTTVHGAFSNARSSKAPPEAAARMFQSGLGIVLSRDSVAGLIAERYDVSIENTVVRSLDKVMERGIVLNRDVFHLVGETGLVIRTVGERRESYVSDVSSILDVAQARRLAKSDIEGIFAGSDMKRSLAIKIALGLLAPNLTYNPSETETRKRQAMDSVRPLRYQIKQGEIILRAGDRVTFAEEPILQEMAWGQRPARRIEMAAGLFFLVLIILFIFYRDVFRYKRKLFFSLKKFLLLGVLVSGTVLAARLVYFFLDAAMDRYPNIDSASVVYALPAAVGALLTVILFDIHIALVFSFIISLIMGLLLLDHPFFVLFTFVGSVVAAFSMVHCDRRSQLLRAGFYVGVANAVMVASLDLYRGTLLSIQSFFDIGFGLVGGLLVAIVGSGLLPLFESLFSITTNIKLLELGNREQPLLRKLELNTPGTYHHSMMVSSLAESAAAAIGANPLMARVSAYYHDIGKMTKAEYFIENQMSSINRHDRLSPNMSALIIISHVKEGIELGKEAGLPPEIIDAIPEHHGTRLIKYFYEKAKKNQDPAQAPVKQEDFRYPGPKPQSRVTALVMMADAVEASSRVLSNPTPGRIRALVTQTLTNIFLDGQFDETDLTLKDLKTIVDTFTKVLTGIFHHRIEYPGWGLPDYGEMGHEDFDKKRPEALQAAKRGADERA